MPYPTLEKFVKAVPQVKSLTPEQQKAAYDIFESMKKENPDMDDGMAIATAIKHAKAGKKMMMPGMMPKEDMPKKDMEKMDEHFYTVNTVALNENNKTSTVEVLRAGVIRDRGLKITKQMLTDFVKHFKENVYGTELQVNLGHNREGEAAGWIKNLFLDPMDEGRLLSDIEWTPLGLEKLKNKLFKFVSAEFADRFPHFETGKVVQNVFSGLALTNVPALKGQSPISLSEEINLISIDNTMFKSLIQKLNERAVVSKEDREMARQLLSELPEAEQAEHKEAVEAVEAKPEVAEPSAEEKAAAEAKAAAEKEAADKAAAEAAAKPAEGEPTAQALSEKLAVTNKLAEQQAAEIKSLNEKLEKKELSEQFEKDFALTGEKQVGLLAASKEKVVSFLMELSSEQRNTFAEIIAGVRAVDLSEIGSGNAEKLSGDKQDQIVKLAEELMEKDKSLSVEAAQKLASKQVK